MVIYLKDIGGTIRYPLGMGTIRDIMSGVMVRATLVSGLRI